MSVEVHPEPEHPCKCRTALFYLSYVTIGLLLSVACLQLLIFLNHSMYFIEDIVNYFEGHSFLLAGVMLLTSTLYQVTPFRLEPIILLMSFYYSRLFGAHLGIGLAVVTSVCSSFISSAITVLTVRLLVRKFAKEPRKQTKSARVQRFSAALMDTIDSHGILLVALLRLSNMSPLVPNILLGFSSISIFQLIIGDLVLIPQYLSLSLYSLSIHDIESIKSKLPYTRFHPSHGMLFLTISLISFIVIVHLLHTSYSRISDRTPVQTVENHSNSEINV